MVSHLNFHYNNIYHYNRLVQYFEGLLLVDHNSYVIFDAIVTRHRTTSISSHAFDIPDQHAFKTRNNHSS